MKSSQIIKKGGLAPIFRRLFASSGFTILLSLFCCGQGKITEQFSLPFDAEIVKTETRAPGFRSVNILLQKNHFNAADLTRVFNEIAKVFPSPVVLTAFACSTREGVNNAIYNDHVAQHERKQIGSLIAEYRRNSYREYFFFTMNDYDGRGIQERTIRDDTESNSNLIESIRSGYEARFNYLIDNGAAVDSVDDKNVSALAVACDSLQDDFAEVLIKRGAEINHQSDEGLTPLMYASRVPTTSLLRLLVKAGADLNLRDKYGNTALMYAVANDQPENVKELLASGAKKNIRNNQGEDALDFAKHFKFTAIIELLEK